MKSKLKFDKGGYCFHQGDVQGFKLTELPKEGLKKVAKRFLAASERSGSLHALFGKYDLYELEDDAGFVIDVHEECILNHSLKALIEGTGVTLNDAVVVQKKDHRHTVVPAGQYYVGIQNRFDPMAGFKKKNVD